MPLPPDAHLIETTLKQENVFEGRLLHVRRDTVQLSNGHTSIREYIVHPGGVVIIPLQEDGCVLLEHQYRYPLSRVMLEFPAGKLDAGEDPLQCGQRELLEETGYRAREWAYAGAMHMAMSYSTEVIHIFFARGLQYAGQTSLDADEFLTSHFMTVEALYAACRSGEVTDAKTLTCTLWLQNVLNGVWTLPWEAPGE